MMHDDQVTIVSISMTTMYHLPNNDRQFDDPVPNASSRVTTINR